MMLQISAWFCVHTSLMLLFLWVMGHFLLSLRANLKINLYHSLLGQLTNDHNLFASKAINLDLFLSSNTSNMLSYSSLCTCLFKGSAIKWKGWLLRLMLCTASGTHKPHPKHSQDPTGQGQPCTHCYKLNCVCCQTWSWGGWSLS